MTHAKGLKGDRFKEESIEGLPYELQTVLEDEFFNKQSGKLVHFNGKAYVILSLGYCNSLGYEIEIEKMNITDNELQVLVKVNKPDGMAGMVITKPVKIISLMDQEHELKKLSVNFQ